MRFFNDFLMARVLTVEGAPVTLGETMEKPISRRANELGQAAIEYLLMTTTLVVCFAAMYGFMQGQVKVLFRAAAVKILRVYY